MSRSWFSLAGVICGILVGLGLLQFKYQDQRTRFDLLAIQKNNKVLFLKFRDKQVHCSLPFAENPCEFHTISRPKEKRALWLGASHLHTVSGYQDGDENVILIANNKVYGKNIALTTVSGGNASFSEFYVAYQYMRSKFKPNLLIIGAVLDDMQEELELSKIDELLESDSVRQALSETQIGRQILTIAAQDNQRIQGRQDRATRQTQTAPVDVNVSRHTKEQNHSGNLQTASEARISQFLNDNFELWRIRKEARGHLHVSLLRLREHFGDFRRWVHGQPSAWYRVNFPKFTWDMQFSAFKTLLNDAAKAGINILVYIAPRPKIAHFPYDDATYAKYKSFIRNETINHGGSFINLEDAVNTEFFGGPPEARDLFHFNAKGHRQFANNILPAIIAEVISNR